MEGNLDNYNSSKQISTFHFIHPTIVDLYINALTLHIMQEQLEKLKADDFSNDQKLEIDKATSEYVISVKRAEDLFKDSKIVQDQLDAFTAQRQGDA